MTTGSGGGLTRAVVSGTLWIMVGTGGRAVVRIGTLAILARLLEPAIFGQMAAALVIVQISEAIGFIGLAPAIVQRKIVTRLDLATAQTAALFLASVLAIGNFLLASVTASALGLPELESVIQVISLIFLLHGFQSLARARLERELAFKRAAKIEVFIALLGNSCVAIPLAYAGWGIWSLVAAQFAQALLSLLALSWFYPPIPSLAFHWASAKELFRFGGGFSLGMLFNRIADQIDYAIVSRYLGPAALGFYSRAYQLMAEPAKNLTTAMSSVLFPALSRIQDEPERLYSAYRRSLAASVVPLAVASVFAWFLAAHLILILLGKNWIEAVEPFKWLAVALLPRAANRINGAILKATGRVFVFAGVQFLFASAVALAAYVGVTWGITGVAKTVAVAIWMHFILTCLVTLACQGIPLSSFFRGLQPAAVLSVVVGLVLYGAEHLAAVIALDFYLAGVLLVGAGGIAALGTVLFSPSWLLGPDAVWIRQRVMDQVMTLLRKIGVAARIKRKSDDS